MATELVPKNNLHRQFWSTVLVTSIGRLMKTRDPMNITTMFNVNGSMEMIMKLDSLSLASLYVIEW